MDIRLDKSAIISGSEIEIPGSKSESNRLLILQALYQQISIENLSDSDDTKLLRNALSSNDFVIDIGHAGTAMRFLTAYFATQDGREVLLTGSDRMKQRPIAILVDALRFLGADITYREIEGFPPLLIKGQKLVGGKVVLPANISSQYITALMLIAPRLEGGLRIILEQTVTSAPYIAMTLGLLSKAGISASQKDSIIEILPQQILPQQTITVEPDWSSASYFYSAVALSELNASIRLKNFRTDSLQGDRNLAVIYSSFGVDTIFEGGAIILRKVTGSIDRIELDLNNTPDIAQTIAATCFGLGIPCRLTGLHTLKIKETDRLLALRDEFRKMGATAESQDDSLLMEPDGFPESAIISTYDDHRMAMAFAPLALKFRVVIRDSEVVSKSYPGFWNDFRKIGFRLS